MTDLPEITWRRITKPNPDRRWWQFWKPKRVLDLMDMSTLFAEHDSILADIPYKETNDAHP